MQRLFWALAFSLISSHSFVFAQHTTLPNQKEFQNFEGKKLIGVPASIAAFSAVQTTKVVELQKEDSSSRILLKGSEEKSIDWFTRNTAIAGLLLGLLNLGFGIWKLWRDRRLSIEDDFWFRKIISPATIEPMLKTVVNLLEEAPPNGNEEDLVRAYSLKVTTEFAKLYSAMHTLGLFDSSLPTEVIKKLSSCEDFLSEFSGKLSPENSLDPPNMHDLRKCVLDELNAALLIIKKRHLKR